ncbi:hypothetical protein ACOMHN_060756 [Nucella lapillus]
MLFLLSRTSYWYPYFTFAMKLPLLVQEVGKNSSDDVTSSLLPLSLASSSSSSGITSAQDDVMTSDGSGGPATSPVQLSSSKCSAVCTEAPPPEQDSAQPRHSCPKGDSDCVQPNQVPSPQL